MFKEWFMFGLIEYSPTKSEFHKDFIIKNSSDWKNMLQTLFGVALPYPHEYKWTKNDDIVNVLKVIGCVPDSNHLFLPSGGGMDIKDADIFMETDCIELIFDHQIYICKPESLQFVSFDADEKWFYFRLETNKLESIISDTDCSLNYEYLIELNDGELVSRNKENDDYVIRNFHRYVSRILCGSMVIFAKASIYNHDSSTYDGRHNKMNEKEFKKYIEESILHLKNI
jgi:serine/threonine-protein kinase